MPVLQRNMLPAEINLLADYALGEVIAGELSPLPRILPPSNS